ncbi:hypothetical protein RRG08_017526 [Elysia crispata]|uniref:Uncharacterized protein n=1 Tax=Elysia crispata TaxID=231223 RepID=A0AAE0Y0F1_9GAST|nr:hypothetical protein RRG08_017526 [Elysia crispata]
MERKNHFRNISHVVILGPTSEVKGYNLSLILEMRCCASGQKDETLGNNCGRSKNRRDPHPHFKVLCSAQLELVQVQVLFRHGARTPFNFISGITEASYDRHMGLDLQETSIPYEVVNILTGKQAGQSPMEQDFRELRLKGGCRAAVLTTVGQKEMLGLGRKIKEAYLGPLRIENYSPDLVRSGQVRLDWVVSVELLGLGRRLKRPTWDLYGLKTTRHIWSGEARLGGQCRAVGPGQSGQVRLDWVVSVEMLGLDRKIKEAYLGPLRIENYSPDLVSIRSTHIERTVKSLRCVMVGIFGRITFTRNNPLKLPVKDIWDEDIFPNKLSCPALRLAVNMILSNLDSIPDYASDKRLVLRALALPPTHLDFSCVNDDATSRVAHGKPYPKVLEPFKEIIETQATRVLRAVTTGRIEGSLPRDDVLMMSIGRLLHGILAEMEDVVCGVIKPRLFLYSGHDTTVIPILEVLGLPQVKWPPFGASLALELYKSHDSPSENQFFVRVVYCWNEQTLPCHKDALIPFAVFRQTMSRYSVSPTEFRRMCGITSFMT